MYLSEFFITTEREMPFEFNDGGREAAGFKGRTGDCVTRAFAIATGKPYREVYDTLFRMINEWSTTSRSRHAKRIRSKSTGSSGTTPRNGVPTPVGKKYIEEVVGWNWFACMKIGSGCKVHLDPSELPHCTLVARVSRHYSAIKNGRIQDTYDPSRGGSRCVYGFWYNPQDKPIVDAWAQHNNLI